MAVTGKPMPVDALWRVRLRLMRRSFATNWELFQETRIGLFGLGIIVLFGLIAVVHPILISIVWDPAVYDPVHGFDFQVLIDGGAHPSPPSWTQYPPWDGRAWSHLLGTDPWGRDVFSQLAFSARAEFFLGIVAAFITVFIGTLVAAAAAYYGGFVDTFFMRLADVVLLFPVIAFLIVLSAMFKDAINLYTLAVILGVLGGFGGITIVLKSQALAVKVKPFVEAARLSGGSSFHIIFSHIIPNLLPLSFLYMMFSVTSAIFSEAVLSFFGILNVRMSWGIMVQMADIAGYLQGAWVIKAWWLFFPASVSITALCAAFYLVGRGMDEIVNPRLRKV